MKYLYCGTNKTALASKDQIASTLLALMKEKPYDEISVSELCRCAGISRQTFYSLFSSRESVMEFALQARYCEGLDIAAPERDREETPLSQLCRSYSGYILQNRGLIKMLVDNRIDYLLYDTFFEALSGCECFLNAVEPCTRRYAASFYAGGVSCVARRYAQEGCTTTADQLVELLMTLFTGALF
jgi:AcrR family transcriptional regulator